MLASDSKRLYNVKYISPNAYKILLKKQKPWTNYFESLFIRWDARLKGNSIDCDLLNDIEFPWEMLGAQTLHDKNSFGEI